MVTAALFTTWYYLKPGQATQVEAVASEPNSAAEITADQEKTPEVTQDEQENQQVAQETALETSSETEIEIAQEPEVEQPVSEPAKTMAKPQHTGKPADYRLGFTTLSHEVKMKDLPVIGAVPFWLRGSFITIGPGKFEIQDNKAKHWLDGFSMIHRFSFKHGKVSYANKLLESKYYQESCAMGVMSNAACACDPNASYFAKLAIAMSGSNDRTPYDNANLNVVAHNNTMLTLTETANPIVFDRHSLKTKGIPTFHDTHKPHIGCAHPYIDQQTGEYISIMTTYSRKNSAYTIYKMGPKSMERVELATITSNHPSYMHSFSLTPHYVILIEIPFVVNPYDLVMSGKPYIENFHWKPKLGSTVWVVNRATGNIVNSYALPAFFTWHHSNAFEQGGNIIIDMPTYPNATMMDSFYLADIHDTKKYHAFPQGSLQRITINTIDKSIQMKALPTTLTVEMPRINPDYVTKPYQFMYGLHRSTATGYYNAIAKIEPATGKNSMWSSAHCYPSEAIFVPQPHAKTEDDGVLLSIVLDGATKTSFLLILDAQKMTELARVYLPHHVPFTVHGNFFKPEKNALMEQLKPLLPH